MLDTIQVFSIYTNDHPDTQNKSDQNTQEYPMNIQIHRGKVI